MRGLAAAAWIVALSVAVLASVWGVRRAGHLQNLELAAYDFCVRRTAAADPRQSAVTVVGIDEADIQAMPTYPITDADMARALRALLAHQPRAIGIDIFRDKPVEPGHDELNALLAEYGHLIVVGRYHELPTLRVPGPAILRGSGRVAFSDQAVDPDGAVRRALLFLNDEEMANSLGFMLAYLHLSAEGIEPQPDPQNPQWTQIGRFTFRPLEAHDGAYVHADAGGYQMLLDFRGPRPIRTLPWRDVLAGNVPDDAVRDRVVLLGVTQTVSVKDHFPTPIDPWLAGVYLHAQAADQIIRSALGGQPLVRWPGEGGEFAWTLLWTLLGGALGWGIRSPWRLTLATLALVGGLSAATVGLFLQYWWLPFVPPLLGLVGSTALVTAYVAQREKQQRQAVTQLFNRCVSPQVVEEVWRRRDELLDGGRLRPREVHATVLFTDLVGFTARAENQSPAQVLDWLNAYMTRMSGLVIAEGGMINKYIGDAIMAVFGVPLVSDNPQAVADNARRAVRCALAMRQALVELNQQWLSEGVPPMGMRIGIQTGPLVAGSLGSAQRLEYTVIGDTVNTASRLESHDKELWNDQVAPGRCRILVGGPTRQLLDDAFHTAPVAEIQLRGRSRNLDVHAVLHYAAPGLQTGETP